jgi:two-component system CheB/CheR fusion protein
MTKKHGPKPNENGSAQKTDNTTTGIVPRSGADPARFPVVDIGASADGLAALEDSDTGTDGSLGIDETRAALDEILVTLRTRTGSDFTAYKRSTIGRRIERRIGVHGMHSVAAYAAFLEKTPYEVDALFKELLISVTSFFRDPEAFAKLEQEIGAVVRSMHEGATFRAWIAGCATGEEAYSIAILLREAIERNERDIKVQIFATDLDPQAIDIARAGRYPDGIAADVTPERLQRFFTRKDNGYRINKDVREMLVFAVQNVIKDPPFTKLDLVSCRNVLIYLEPELQRRVLSVFSYALRPQGLLMLGTSESVGGFDDRFAMLDKRWKVFQRRTMGDAAAPLDFPSELPSTIARPSNPSAAKEHGRTGISAFAERLLLAAFVPPTVILSERGELVYLHGHTGPFLEPAQGEPTHNVFGMAREGLRLELPAAIRQAAVSKEPVVRRGLQVKTNGGFSPVTITARRLVEPETLRGAFLVSFELEATPEPEPKARPTQRQHKQLQRITALEEELRQTRENLQGTIEALETSNEELKSTNEELQSTNEELQSANEELETSREEMQSLNEELQTVNTELGERNRSLSQVNDDMQNLLNSTDVATVFLDDKMAIKRFTTQAKKVFSLIDTDIGRPISDLAVNLQYDQLAADAREVLRSLVFREREIQTKEGAWRLMRIMPYRTHENLIDGLVITFVDIDRIKRAQLEAQEGREYAEAIVTTSGHAMLVLDRGLRVVTANPSFFRLLGVAQRALAHEPFTELLGGALDDAGLRAALNELFTSDQKIEAFPLLGSFPRVGKLRLIVNAYKMSTHDDGAGYALLEFALEP